MIRLTAVAVCVLLTLTVTGQQREFNVLLNDGSRISGTIVSDSAGYLDIRVTSPQVIRIGKSQVSSVEALKYPLKQSMKTSGYYVRIATGFLSGKNESGNQGSLSLHLSNGFQFKNGIAVGIGSGMEELGLVLVPLYADLRFTPLNSGLSPYFWLKAGHGFAVKDEGASYFDDAASSGNHHDGGFLFSTGAGISMFSWHRTAVNLGIGYRYQKVTVSSNQYWWGSVTSVRETITWFNRLELHLGFVFM